jgi:hypothetical protein
MEQEHDGCVCLHVFYLPHCLSYLPVFLYDWMWLFFWHWSIVCLCLHSHWRLNFHSVAMRAYFIITAYFEIITYFIIVTVFIVLVLYSVCLWCYMLPP